MLCKPEYKYTIQYAFDANNRNKLLGTEYKTINLRFDKHFITNFFNRLLAKSGRVPGAMHMNNAYSCISSSPRFLDVLCFENVEIGPEYHG